ncbi:uncharacterized protein LOC135943773 [Cloeon dipterum]|uniref:uncharacterized protein LOC135943773 n=1 Tax=Cloeon dipterum TaxID=197152 RepID=UPI0032202707
MDNSENAGNDRKRPIESESENELEEKIPRLESVPSASLAEMLRVHLPPLLHAAQFADVELCRKLVEDEGADVNVTDFSGYDVYHCASMNENNCDLELLKFFADKKATMKRLNESEADAVQLALHRKNFKFAAALFELYESEDSFLLHCICTQLESMKFAYEQDPSVVKMKGDDAFDLRILDEMAWYQDLEAFKWIIDVAKNFGVELSKSKELQLSILKHSALNEDDGDAIANFILSTYEKDLTEQDLTPLLLEVLPNGNLKVVELLVRKGADLNVRMPEEEGSLFEHCVALNVLNAAKFVYQWNAEEIDISTLMTAANLENIEMMRAYINSVNDEGKTALHVAVDMQNLNTFKALLDIGADLTVEYRQLSLVNYCLKNLFLEGANLVYAKDPSQIKGKHVNTTFMLSNRCVKIEKWIASL